MDTEVDSNNEFGGSLPVENVQALASNYLADIPPRYIRPEIESVEVLTDGSLQIPVIDMAKLVEDDDVELQTLHLACKHWGFFQLINHGVPDEVIGKMKIDMQEFFKLPLEEKMACAQLPNTIEGYGQAFVVSEDQKLDWGDMLFLFAQPVSTRNMRFWPTTPASFRASLEKYSCELEKVKICLLKAMAKNLGLQWGKLACLFEDGGRQALRMNYYPPCVVAHKVLGITPHSDATGLTLLLQVNEVKGLQIMRGGTWVSIEPLSSAFIVNVGDIIEIISNGKYKSIEHRAVVNPEKERLSIASFHSPNMKAMIGPLADLVEDKENYKTITNEEFVRLVVASKLDGKNLLNNLKL